MVFPICGGRRLAPGTYVVDASEGSQFVQWKWRRLHVVGARGNGRNQGLAVGRTRAPEQRATCQIDVAILFFDAFNFQYIFIKIFNLKIVVIKNRSMICNSKTYKT